MPALWLSFWTLVKTPFLHSEMIWGIVPLYFGWILNELTSSKASYRTAIATGFSFLWAAAHWVWNYGAPRHMPAINILVTVLVGIFGLAALISGLTRRFPKYCSFLGHTRFSNYFMIAIFPMQSGFILWSWQNLAAILLFAIPIWMVIAFLMLFLREK